MPNEPRAASLREWIARGAIDGFVGGHNPTPNAEDLMVADRIIALVVDRLREELVLWRDANVWPFNGEEYRPGVQECAVRLAALIDKMENRDG